MATELQCIIKHETDASILVVLETTGEEIWLPLSQVTSIHREAKVRGVDRIFVADWLARKHVVD